MEVKEYIENINKTWEEYKKTLDKYGTESAEAKERIERLEAALNEYENVKKSVEEIETKLNRLPVGEGKEADNPETKAFCNWVRKGQVGPDEAKLLSTDDATAGGYRIPSTMSARIIELKNDIDPIRSLASVETITVGDTLEMVKESGAFTCGWTTERATRTTSDNGTFGLLKIVVEEMYAMPQVTQKTLDDSGWDVEGWIIRKLAQLFAKTEGTAFLSGSGVGQPRGILTHADVTEVASGSDSAIKADYLIDMCETLHENYNANARWLMKKATRGEIRKLKDGQGNYLWMPGIQTGDPGTLLGYPLSLIPNMDSVASGKYPIIFGDIRQGYQIVDKAVMGMIRDNVTTKGFVLFYTTARTGGDVVDPDAMLKMKIAASV